MKYRVFWRSKLTGYTGHGAPLDKETAEACVEAANKAFPHVEHWVEPVPADSATG